MSKDFFSKISSLTLCHMVFYSFMQFYFWGKMFLSIQNPQANRVDILSPFEIWMSNCTKYLMWRNITQTFFPALDLNSDTFFDIQIIKCV